VRVTYDSERERLATLRALGNLARLRRAALVAIARKRSWRPSERAMASADAQEQIKLLEALIVASSGIPGAGLAEPGVKEMTR
jgi:hypothetical protein